MTFSESWHRARNDVLRELKEKHRVSDAEFLVDVMDYLTALAKTDLLGDFNYSERNIVKKLFQTYTMRIGRFHETWNGSQPSAGVVCKRVEHLEIFYSVMNNNRRGLLVKHLLGGELDQAIADAQKADEIHLVRRLYYVKNLYAGDTREEAGNRVEVSRSTTIDGHTPGTTLVSKTSDRVSGAAGPETLRRAAQRSL